MTIHIPEAFREGPDNVYFGPDGWNREVRGVYINRIMRARDGEEDEVSGAPFDFLGTECVKLEDGWTWPVALFADSPAIPAREDCERLSLIDAYDGMAWIRKYDGTWRWAHYSKAHYMPSDGVLAPPDQIIRLPAGALPAGSVVHTRDGWFTVRSLTRNEYRLTPWGYAPHESIDEVYAHGTEVCKHCRKPLVLDPCEDVPGACQSCVNEHYYACSHCGELVHGDDTHSHGDDTYCDDCWREVSSPCNGCGDRFHEDDLTDGYCESCLDEDIECDSCGEPTPRRGMVGGECPSCAGGARAATVHQYNYKPDFEFFPDSNSERYYGVELEIDGVSQDNKYHAGDIRACAPDGFLYAKHDGSIPRGFEMVSMPATLDYHMTEANWPDVCAKALELGYRSHDAETCGLHVHISREAFGDGDNRDANIAKLLLLFDMHWEKILRFARRTPERAERWAKRYSMKRTGDTLEARKLARDAKGNMSRYYAVNLQNEDTVEVRIARGSLNAQTVLATIQWMDALVEIVTTTPVADIAGLKWSEMRRTFDRYNHLKAYMARRFDGALMVKDEADEADPMPDLPDGDEVPPVPAAAPGWYHATQDNIREGMRCRLRVPIVEVMARVGGAERVWREMNEAGDMVVGTNWEDGTCSVSSDAAHSSYMLRIEHIEVLIPERWVPATMENAVVGRRVRVRSDFDAQRMLGAFRETPAALLDGNLRIRRNDGSTCPILTEPIDSTYGGAWLTLEDAEVYVTEEN